MPAADINEATRQWARQSRLAQGLPEKVEDPVAIAQVAAIFRSVQPPTDLSSPVHDRNHAEDAGPDAPASFGAGRSHQDKGRGTAARSEDVTERNATEPGDTRAHVA
jgi:hypothetical protein